MKTTLLRFDATFRWTGQRHGSEGENFQYALETTEIPTVVRKDAARGGHVVYRTFEVLRGWSRFKDCHVVSIKRDNKREATNYIWIDGDKDNLYVVELRSMPNAILLFMACLLGLAKVTRRRKMAAQPSSTVNNAILHLGLKD